MLGRSSAERLKPYAWISIVVSVLVGLYSFMGLAATASLSGSSGSDCRRCGAMWTTAIAVSVLVLIATPLSNLKIARPRVSCCALRSSFQNLRNERPHLAARDRNDDHLDGARSRRRASGSASVRVPTLWRLVRGTGVFVDRFLLMDSWCCYGTQNRRRQPPATLPGCRLHEQAILTGTGRTRQRPPNPHARTRTFFRRGRRRRLSRRTTASLDPAPTIRAGFHRPP